MKKLTIISGALSLLLMTLLLTGWVSLDTAEGDAILEGNRYFELAEYENALTAYETGLAKNAENKALNFSAAQAAYLLGEYGKAAEYFENAEDLLEKFLSAGNIYYRAGEMAEEAEEKAGLYAQALKLYQDGMVKYPQNVPLKFNYELVSAKLNELLEEQEQESEQQGEEGEEGEEQESQEQEGQENQEGQESQENQESQQGQEQESSQGEESEANQSQAQEGEESPESDSQGEEEGAIDQEAIARVLQMLEEQEEQSLKNNQEVASGYEGKNGW